MSKSNRDFLKRKASSIPSLFEGELPGLTTIREATDNHSSSSSSSDSPFPDLIIEKEPNRHDEPKEFYDDLLKRLLKFHRKFFSSESIEGNDDVTNYCNESVENTSSISTNNFFENNILKLTEGLRLSAPGTSSEYTTLSETEKSWYEYHDIISTSVMIHREEIDDNKANKQFVAERGENALAETGVNEAMEYTTFSSESDSEVEEESDEQIELMRGATKTQYLSSGPSIDTMINTIESPNIYTTPRSISLSSEGRQESHGDYILASSQSHMKMSTEIADDFQGVFHSTPHTNEETTHSRSGSKRSSTSNESSICPEKRCKYLDTGTQTSQENRSHNINWETLRKNLFIGTPKIYRACSCTHHACES